MIRPLFYSQFAGDPFFNMAFDEWLLARAETTPGFFAVRLYTWEPEAITFGLNQRDEKAFLSEELRDTPVIRRVTGGRAIYHDHSELTYAVALNHADCSVPGLAGSVSQTSTAIAKALQEFLGRTGQTADYVRRSAPENARPEFFHMAPCFASQAKYELVVDHRKLVASAQRRLDYGLLQHGSIKLRGLAPHPALGDRLSSDAPQAILPDQFNDSVTVFRETFEAILAVTFDQLSLSAEEAEIVRERAHSVRKNNLVRRDVIKQSSAAVSL